MPNDNFAASRITWSGRSIAQPTGDRRQSRRITDHTECDIGGFGRFTRRIEPLHARPSYRIGLGPRALAANYLASCIPPPRVAMGSEPTIPRLAIATYSSQDRLRLAAELTQLPVGLVDQHHRNVVVF